MIHGLLIITTLLVLHLTCPKAWRLFSLIAETLSGRKGVR